MSSPTIGRRAARPAPPRSRSRARARPTTRRPARHARVRDLRLPVLPAVERRKRLVVGLQQESGAPGHLRHWRGQAEVPDGGGDDIDARPQERCEIVGLEAPVLGVAAPGACAHARAVDVQEIALVARDVHEQPVRDGVEREDATEVVDAGVALRRAGRGNPRRRPLPGEQYRIHCRGRLSRRHRRRGQHGQRDGDPQPGDGCNQRRVTR